MAFKLQRINYLLKFQCNTACDTHNDCCPDYNDICTDENSVSDDDLKTISNHLFELAIEKQVGIVLNLQGHAQMGSSQDNAPEKYVNIILSKRKITFKKY